jgi:hypothetical protein
VNISSGTKIKVNEALLALWCVANTNENQNSRNQLLDVLEKMCPLKQILLMCVPCEVCEQCCVLALKVGKEQAILNSNCLFPSFFYPFIPKMMVRMGAQVGWLVSDVSRGRTPSIFFVR